MLNLKFNVTATTTAAAAVHRPTATTMMNITTTSLLLQYYCWLLKFKLPFSIQPCAYAVDLE